MTTIQNLQVKIFLNMGIPFGIGMVVYSLLNGRGFVLWEFLLSVILFGGLMAFFMVREMKKKFKNIGKAEIDEQDLELAYTKTVVSNLSPEQLLEKLKGNRDFKLAKFSHNKKEINLKAGMKWLTWAEKLNINSKAISDSNYEYEITSEARTKTIMRDYTLKFQFVRKVEELLGTST